MALRVLLVLLGLGATGWAVARDTQVHRCNGAAVQTFAAQTEADASAVAARLEAHCRGAAILASGAAVLVRGGEPRAATRLAAEAVRREPRNGAAWVGVGTAARASHDPRRLALARARLKALDPVSRALG